jgi:hypothetical protein
LLWREFQPDSYTSRGQIFRSVEEWLFALQNDGISLNTVNIPNDLAYDTSVAANHAVVGTLNAEDLEEMRKGSAGDTLDRFSSSSKK